MSILRFALRCLFYAGAVSCSYKNRARHLCLLVAPDPAKFFNLVAAKAPKVSFYPTASVVLLVTYDETKVSSS